MSGGCLGIVSHSLLLATVCLAVNGCGVPQELSDMYVRDSSYPTYSNVAADNAFVSGWVPGCLPKSATDIRERHSLDSNECWARFTVPRNELAIFAEKLTKLDASEVVWPRSPNHFPDVPKISWWPSDLVAGKTPRLTVFRHPDTPETYVVLDRDQSLVYYWYPSG